MKKTYIIIFTIFTLLIGIIISGYYLKENSHKVFFSKDTIGISLYEGTIYNSLKELEHSSEIIIEAKYTGNTEFIPFPESGDPEAVATLSEVIVKKSYHGNLKKGDKIYIGSGPLEKRDTHILFLYKFDMPIGGKESYVIIGGPQGSFNLDIIAKERKDTNPENPNVVDNTEYTSDMAKTLKNLREEVLEKYGK